MINILDRYIIRNFLGTLFFMLILLIAIFVIIDIQSNYQDFNENGFSIVDTLRMYYPYYVVWAVNVFASILVFISVIYFTSRLTNNTEIVAITSSGTSFFRFSRPYLLVGIFIASLSLVTNHFLLPWANIKKNEFNVKTLTGSKREAYFANQNISSQISPTEYLFVNSYNRQSQRGIGFMYQKFNSQRVLLQEIRATEIYWSDKDNTYVLGGYFEKTYSDKGKILTLKNGQTLKKHFNFTPDELLPEAFVAETMNTPELLKFIKKEKMKGANNVNIYLNELHQRTSASVAVLILTFLALSLSSTKRRGGIGLNLAIGISSAFLYIFSFQALQVFSSKGIMPSWFAVWLPNFVFGIVTLILYFKRAYA
ncbi:LptF/LptG family permease [Apibacter raozihei]|uniref:LptF/LptG family permease n=1 Tax=Apibacter raozihei TaxID=2500547 RepID=UPI000FE3EE14|nr:LptF/LptG family permease [Apibacter raozihei]